MPTDLDNARYVSFKTYKKDGTAVSTPVWVVPYDNGYAFTTEPNAYKVRRIRRDARATLTVCDMRGKIASGAVEYLGSAVVLDAERTREVEQLIAKKYWVGIRLLGVISIARKILGKGSSAGDAAIKVTLHS